MFDKYIRNEKKLFFPAQCWWQRPLARLCGCTTNYSNQNICICKRWTNSCNYYLLFPSFNFEFCLSDWVDSQVSCYLLFPRFSFSFSLHISRNIFTTYFHFRDYRRHCCCVDHIHRFNSNRFVHLFAVKCLVCVDKIYITGAQLMNVYSALFWTEYTTAEYIN